MAGRPVGPKKDARYYIIQELEKELDQSQRTKLLMRLTDLDITRYKRKKKETVRKPKKVSTYDRHALRKPPAEEGARISIDELLKINSEHSRYGTPKPVEKDKETENLENFMDLLNTDEEKTDAIE